MAGMSNRLFVAYTVQPCVLKAGEWVTEGEESFPAAIQNQGKPSASYKIALTHRSVLFAGFGFRLTDEEQGNFRDIGTLVVMTKNEFDESGKLHVVSRTFKVIGHLRPP